MDTNRDNLSIYENYIVVHIDRKIGELTLKAFFSNESLTGGGEILNVSFNPNSQTPMAFIHYKNKSDKERVLKKNKFTIEDYEFTVVPYKTKRDSSARRISQDIYENKNFKDGIYNQNKENTSRSNNNGSIYDNFIVVHIDRKIGELTLKAFFSNESLTGGGEILNVSFNPNSQTPMAFIHYKNKSDKERVLKKNKFTIEDYEFTVVPYKTKRDSSATRISLRDSSEPVARSILHNNDPKTIRDTSCVSLDLNHKPKIYENNKTKNSNPKRLFDIRPQSTLTLKKNFNQPNETNENYTKKYVLIDGLNVGISYCNGGNFSFKGLKIAIDFLKNKEIEFDLNKKKIKLVLKAILPANRNNPNISDKHSTIDFEFFNELNDNEYLKFVPVGQYDDDYVVNFALQLNGLILSDDRYTDKEFTPKKYQDYFSDNQIKYAFCDDAFNIPHFPNGRKKKSLYELLTDIHKLESSACLNSNSESESESDSDSNSKTRSNRSTSAFRNKKTKKNMQNICLLKLKNNPSLFSLISKNHQKFEEQFSVRLINQKDYKIRINAIRQVNINNAYRQFKIFTQNFEFKEISNEKYAHDLIKRKIKEFEAEESKEFYIDTFRTEKFLKIYGSSFSNEGKEKLNDILQNLNINSYSYKINPNLMNKLDQAIKAIENSFIVKIEKKYSSLIIYTLDVNTQQEVIQNLDINLSDNSIFITPKSNMLLKLFEKSERKELNKWFKENDASYIIQKNIISVKSKAKLLNDAKQKIEQELDEIEKSLCKKRLEISYSLYRYLLNFNNQKKLENKCNVSIFVPKMNLKPKFIFEMILNKTRMNKLRFLICQGKIEDSLSDYVINSINEQMTHIDGVAKSIADLAGDEYIQECNSKKNNILEKVFVTTAGNLNAFKIVNVICDKYELGSNDLVQKYSKCLNECFKNNFNNNRIIIAMTLLGTGILNWPIDESLNQLVSSLEYLAVSNNTKSNVDILLIEKNENYIDHISKIIITKQVLFNNLKIKYPSKQILIENKNEKNWYWYDDENQWKKFRSEIERKINENAKLKNLFQMEIDGKLYLMNLLNKSQTNVHTNHSRPISDQVPFVNTAQWYWIEKKKISAYNLQQNSIIEEAYNKRQKSIKINIKRHCDDITLEYLIDFNKMIQVNMSSGFKREIKREVIQQKANIIIENEDEDDEINIFDFLDSNIWLIGKNNDVNKLINELDFIKINKKTENIENISFKTLNKQKLIKNNFKISEQVSDNILKITKNGVEIVEENNGLKLTGLLIGDLKSVKEELLTILIKTKEITYPSNWTNLNNQDKNLIELNKNCPEWDNIEQNFKKTLPNKQITKIERVQVKSIYENFEREKNYLIEKRKNKVNERFLWHGTSTTDPMKILNSRHGFDFRYCERGMWGTGTYFAENAYYSANKFAYKSNQNPNELKLFYCQVLLGDCKEMSENPSLRMPPPKEMDPNDMYDSVSGVTGGSKVFIVYENQKAYPAYLVTFK